MSENIHRIPEDMLEYVICGEKTDIARIGVDDKGVYINKFCECKCYVSSTLYIIEF